MLKPQTLRIAMEGGKEESVVIDPTRSVAEITKMICDKLGLTPTGGVPRPNSNEFSLVLSTGSNKMSLNPHMALRSQAKNYRKSTFLIKPLDEISRSDSISKPKTEEARVIVYSQTNSKEVEAATFDKLVEHLLDAESGDETFMDAFVMTYHTFCTSDALIGKLLAIYHAARGKGGSGTKKRIVVVLQLLIETRYKDLSDANKTTFKNFLEKVVKNDQNFTERESAVSLLEQALTQAEAAASGLGPAVAKNAQPPKTLPKSLYEHPSFFDLDEVEVARQLCLMEWKAFSRIKPEEFANQSWSKEKTQDKCPNIMAMIASFNTMSGAVATLILNERKVRDRRKIMWKLVSVAQKLLQFNNFHTLMAFLSAFNNSAILRLKWTRERLPSPTKKFLEEAEKLMSMEGSYKEYRGMLKNAHPPCIPYIGVCLADLTFIEDGNPDDINGLTNFYKRRLVYRVLSSIREMQATPYTFSRVPEITNLFRALSIHDDSRLYALSLECEPRNAKKSAIE